MLNNALNLFKVNKNSQEMSLNISAAGDIDSASSLTLFQSIQPKKNACFLYKKRNSNHFSFVMSI